ncbi:zinc ribbon domain-containing protein (plasmid) [Acaryochloris sp. 'Moss Beach']|nr:zinc ribbon domain-containing protein [Acaryochloris sp. 'Moss Beach']
MAYVCELDSGQNVYLDNQGDMTLITSMMVTPGQQQQSSNSFETGCWTALPEVYRTSQGAVIKLTTTQGEQFIQVQGSKMSNMASMPSLQKSQQMQINQGEATSFTASIPVQETLPQMQPMQPMQPMKMGDMEMGMNPMEMRMGNMHLSMESKGSESAYPEKTQSTGRNFCNQCGVALDPEDRFCSSCGHKLA